MLQHQITKLVDLGNWVLEKENSYMDAVKASYREDEVRKRPAFYYDAIIKIRKKAWVNAARLFKMVYKIYLV